jgi:putative membrane protein
MGWTFEPGVVAGLMILSAAYALAATRFRARVVALGGPPPRWLPPGAISAERQGRLAARQVVCYYLGVLAAGLALLSPLHVLGEHSLLTAHMVQHLAITQVAAPLLLLGIPGWMLRPLLLRPPLRDPVRALVSPIQAFAFFNLVFVGWHVPALYDLSLHVAPLHALEHGLFFGLALAAWWPVLGPLPELPRLPYGGQVLYLFFMSVPPTLLGAVITLTEGPLYATYWAAERVSVLGFPPLEPLADQQLGGLTMWIPGALGYFLVLSIVWFLWLERRSPLESPAYGAVNPSLARRPAPARPAPPASPASAR